MTAYLSPTRILKRTTMLRAWMLGFAFLAMDMDVRGENEKIVERFSSQTLTSTYYSEGTAVGDLNQDGVHDVVYGPYWFAGPDFKSKSEFYPAVAQPMDKYADHFFAWVYDFDQDGSNDIFTVGFPGTPAYVYRNPGPAARHKHWEKIQVFDWVSNESPQWTNIIGDDRPELVCTRDGFYGYASVDWSQPLKPWVFHPISERIAAEKFGHGLGVGDVNGDGRFDIIQPKGWFEQPAKDAGTQRWRLHPAKFTNAGGGAEMYAYDVDGDGDNDIITSLAAHDFGLAWFEQVRIDDEIDFKEHLIVGSRRSENKYGVLFSEPHSVALADIDGDGLKDIITGKTYYSHHQKSPLWDAGAVVYWFKLVRSANGVDWLPYLADGNAGIGRQIVVHDINKDGLLDLATGGMLGSHVLMHQRAGVDLAAWQAIQPKIFTGQDEPAVSAVAKPPAEVKTNAVNDGRVEGEALSTLVTGGATKPQGMAIFRGARWSGNEQLWWTGARPGHRLSAKFVLAAPANFLEVVMTRAKNYGMVKLSLDGRVLSEKIDLYSPRVEPTELLKFATPNLAAGEHELVIEIIGTNPAAQPAHMVGIDYVRFADKDQPTAVIAPARSNVAANVDELKPVGIDGKTLNLDFETGDLSDWKAEGAAFANQPIQGDVVAKRRQDMRSQHRGDYWIGTFEHGGDILQGTLTSEPFVASERYASFFVGGGDSNQTRVELWGVGEDKPFYQITGQRRENMERVVVELRRVQEKPMYVRLVDEGTGGWGHLNFDHFRFHRDKPGELTSPSVPLVADQYPHQGLPGEAAAAAMKVPEGFRVTLRAAEPDIQQPIAMAFDHRGRLWVAEAFEYPTRASGDRGRDRVLIFEDQDGDGKYDSRKVFYEGLNLVSGLEVGFGGVWVGAAPYLMFIPDKNQDDQPDGSPQILLDGWGFEDTHETLNTFAWGPDGWLYGCHGVFTHSRVGKPGTPNDARVPINAGVWRYHPVDHRFEVFAHGTSNPWGIAFDEFGESFVTVCVIPHLFHMIPGARYHRQSGQHFNPHTYLDIKTIAEHLHYQGATPHGGNGKSDAAGGGHAHAGAMIYQGGRWPDKYKSAIMMNNIHGQRLNVDLLEPKGSGYVGKRGEDFLLTGDMASQIINLQYGPDGQVTFIDWYDMQACHSRESTKHDRTNGRIYKVSFDDQAAQKENLGIEQSSDTELASLSLHSNEWVVRHARQLLQERLAATGKIDPKAIERLKEIATKADDPRHRLRAAWTLHTVRATNGDLLEELAKDQHPNVRSWALRLAFDRPAAIDLKTKIWKSLAQDRSPVVRLTLISTAQQIEAKDRWPFLDTFPIHESDAVDHNLPLMIWYAAEPMADQDPDRALVWAMNIGAKIPLVRDFMLRRVAGQGSQASIERLMTAFSNSLSDETRLNFLRAIQTALSGQRSTSKPKEWDAAFARAAASSNDELRLVAASLGNLFGDVKATLALQQLALTPTVAEGQRIQAMKALLVSRDPELVPMLLQLVKGEPRQSVSGEMRLVAIRGLAQYDRPEIVGTLIDAYSTLDAAGKNAALATLSGRISSANGLLTAIAEKKIAVADLSADLARQIEYLNDPGTKSLLDKVWGQIRQSPAEKLAQVQKYKGLVADATMASADVHLGRAIFAKTCQRCHALYAVGQNLGPDLTGSNRANIDYLLENIVDPSAVMANEYRQTILLTEDGQVVTGILKQETDKTVTVQTVDSLVTLPKGEISQRRVSDKSMMPDDQLQPFTPHEIRSLIAYLRDTRQVPMRLNTGNVAEFFNGRDLAGWSGNPELWKVENGEIVGKSQGLKRNEFLISETLASDFTLTLEVKLVGNLGNSGIQFRSLPIDGGLVQGYQADAGPGWWGKLYEEHGRKLLWDKSGEAYLKPNEWNTYKVEAKGSRVRTWINDQLCVDLDDPAGRKEGIFALQLHSGGPTEVRFRKLSVAVE